MMYVAAVFTMVAAGLFVASGHVDALGDYGRLLKMTGSCGFLTTAILAGAFKSRYGVFIFVGLVFSWFGDLFLSYSGMFLYGLVSFLLGHVMYCVAYASYAIRPKQSAIAFAIVALPILGVAAWLFPNVEGGMRIPVMAYMIVISSMLLLSAGLIGLRGGVIAFVGALAFWLSDIFVARGNFVTADMWNGLIGLPLYFGGQALLAISISYVNAPDGDPASAAPETRSSELEPDEESIDQVPTST